MATVLAMLIGLDVGPSIWVGVAAVPIVLGTLFIYIYGEVNRERARFTAHFPTPSANPVIDHQE